MTIEQLRILKIESFETKSKISLSNSQVYVLPIEVVLTNQLVPSIVLTESQFELIEFEASIYEAFMKAKMYLAMRDHSTGELKMKLKKKKFPDESIARAIKKCSEFGYLDDERYAYALAEKLVVKKPCGKPFLMAYLQKKLIPRDLGDSVATMIFASLDVAEMAVVSLEKKWHMYNQLALEDARNKSYNYLARRGFSFGEAKDAFEIVFNKNKEELNN